MDDWARGIFSILVGTFVGTFGGFLVYYTLSGMSLYSEVDGTVRDKYISHSNQYLTAEYSTGEINRWEVIPEVYDACEIGDSLHRDSNGTITCD